MALYTDKLTGDELLSSYLGAKEIDNVVLRAVGNFVTKRGDVDIDIGANPSADGADEGEGVDSAGMSQVIDIVDTMRLQKAEGLVPTKKDFAGIIKAYLEVLSKKLKEEGKSEDEIKTISTDIKNYCKKIVSDFKQWEFYTGESQDPEGALAMCHWEDVNDEEKPVFYIWSKGVNSQKI